MLRGDEETRQDETRLGRSEEYKRNVHAWTGGAYLQTCLEDALTRMYGHTDLQYLDPYGSIRKKFIGGNLLQSRNFERVSLLKGHVGSVHTSL